MLVKQNRATDARDRRADTERRCAFGFNDALGFAFTLVCEFFSVIGAEGAFWQGFVYGDAANGCNGPGDELGVAVFAEDVCID